MKQLAIQTKWYTRKDIKRFGREEWENVWQAGVEPEDAVAGLEDKQKRKWQ